MSDTSHEDRVAYLKRLALDVLNRYHHGLEDLDQLVADMKSIIRSFEEVADPLWTKTLVKRWGELEILYALVLDEDRSGLTDDEEVDVQRIVQNFRSEFS